MGSSGPCRLSIRAALDLLACGYTLYVDARRKVLVAFWLPLLLLLPAGPLLAAGKPILVCYGDSITAGRGLPAGQSFPDDLQRKLDAQGYRYQVINEGTSGATTKDALAGLPYLLRRRPQVVIVEFGGNDGLRGLPLAQTRSNLDQVLTALQKAHVRILLAGITLPPDYGSDYIHAFDRIFRDLATQHRVALVPMLYVNLINVPGTIQEDGIHPTAKGSMIIADTLLPVLKPLLRKGP